MFLLLRSKGRPNT